MSAVTKWVFIGKKGGGSPESTVADWRVAMERTQFQFTTSDLPGGLSCA